MFQAGSECGRRIRSPQRPVRPHPLAVLFVLLGGLKLKAWIAGLISLAVALVVAVALFGMPVGQSLSAAVDGALFGFFPILWIVTTRSWI